MYSTKSQTKLITKKDPKRFRVAGEKLTQTRAGKKLLPSIRRAFKFQTYGAETFVIRYRGKLRFLRVSLAGAKNKRWVQREFAEMRLANILFPRNTLKPVSIIELTLSEPAEKKYGIITEIVKNRSIEYKRYQSGFYNSNLPKEKTGHEYWTATVATPLAEKIKKKTGIEFQTQPVNVANSKGCPVFFELEKIDYQKLEDYLSKQTPLTRQRAKRILQKKY